VLRLVILRGDKRCDVAGIRDALGAEAVETETSCRRSYIWQLGGRYMKRDRGEGCGRGEWRGTKVEEKIRPLDSLKV